MRKNFKLIPMDDDTIRLIHENINVINVRNELEFDGVNYNFHKVEVVDGRIEYVYLKFIEHFRKTGSLNNVTIIESIINDDWLLFLYCIAVGSNNLTIKQNQTQFGSPNLSKLHELERLFNIIKSPSHECFQDVKPRLGSFNLLRLEHFLNWYSKHNGYDYDLFEKEIDDAEDSIKSVSKTSWRKINTVCNMVINGVFPDELPYPIYKKQKLEEKFSDLLQPKKFIYI